MGRPESNRDAPVHRGHDGNPDGWLSYSDALERSCNVFFETVADRLGPAGIDRWYKAFGFGELTGIGIRERVRNCDRRKCRCLI